MWRNGLTPDQTGIAAVQTMAARYETRHDERLVLDTRRDLDTCVQDVLDYLDRS